MATGRRPQIGWEGVVGARAAFMQQTLLLSRPSVQDFFVYCMWLRVKTRIPGLTSQRYLRTLSEEALPMTLRFHRVSGSEDE